MSLPRTRTDCFDVDSVRTVKESPSRNFHCSVGSGGAGAARTSSRQPWVSMADLRGGSRHARPRGAAGQLVSRSRGGAGELLYSALTFDLDAGASACLHDLPDELREQAGPAPPGGDAARF